ncbi:myelin-associated glycoprotein-like [Mantella aurantiaca]
MVAFVTGNGGELVNVVLPRVLGAGWSVRIPQQIRAISGDCVVIPCWYTLPASESFKKKEITWYQEETQKIIFSSKLRGQNTKASLVDDFEVGNCSLWIRSITTADSMMYRFLIELPGIRNYSSPSSVDLRVSDVPPAPELQVSSENIIEGDTVIVTCATNHSCNIKPPSLVWSHVLGEISTRAVDLGNGIWQLVSTQTITASARQHRLAVLCRTKYSKGPTSPDRSITMDVQYSPKNTTVTVNAGEVREGENVSLWCSSQSNPEVSRYIWNALTDDGRLIPLTGNRTTILVTNIKPNMRSVYCTAQNAMGIQASPVVELNITYKPQITQESYCQPMLTVMKCKCVVKANPPPFVIWRLLNANITKTEEGYDVITSFYDHVTKSTLKGPASAMTSASCYSENKEGADELLLPVHLDFTKYFIIAGATGIAALFMVAVTWKLVRRRKNTEVKNETKDCHHRNNQYESQPYPVYESADASSLHGDAESYSLYANTEFAMKTDEETYGNTAANDHDSTYECSSFEDDPIYANT